MRRAGEDGFLFKGQETDIDVVKWKQRYWATREKYHVLWQTLNNDGLLEDVELWFPREDNANAEMVHGKKLVNGSDSVREASTGNAVHASKVHEEVC